MLEQDVVELGPDDLPAVVSLAAHLAECQLPLLASPFEVRAVLAPEAVLLDLLARAEQVEDRQHGGQDRLTDVVAREAVTLEQGHAPPLPRQQGGGSRAGGSAADDQNLSRLLHQNSSCCSVGIGRRCAHGRAASSWAATRSKRSSRP